MTANALPDIDRSPVEELRRKVPGLSELELPSLPSMQDVGKTADQTIDRLLGRKRTPVWPWIAAGIGLMAVIGVIAAYFAWFRRPTWDSTHESTTKAWTGHDAMSDSAGEASSAVGATVDGGSGSRKRRSSGTGPAAAEISSASTPYPIEEA